MLFFLSLSIEGALAGTLYALIALAFVIVYKASRVINFALGEWQMLATLLVAWGLNVLGLDLAAAMAIACAGMFVFAFLLNSLVLRHLVGQPLISLLMVTLGVGALIRGVAQLLSGSVPGGILLPIPSEPLVVNDLRIPADKLVAALIAASSIALVSDRRRPYRQQGRTRLLPRLLHQALF
jgi:branched-chain amino acid transport system permease protein